MKGDRERLRAGFDDYIPKPIRYEDLLAALERLVPLMDDPASSSKPKLVIDRERI
jgi:CheY-like chemotaxis protein